MQTDVLNEIHPHDPEACFLTREQADDLLRYLAPDRPRLHFFHGSGSNWQSVHLFDGTQEIVAWGCEDLVQGRSCYEAALRQAGYWPDRLMAPPPVRFVNIGASVMRGEESICLARSNTYAKRIAAALNWYLPGRRGS